MKIGLFQNVQKLAASTFDISEYVMNIAKKEGLVKGLKPIPNAISLHRACHSRAQVMSFKANEMLRLIPKAKISITERCSGHGGTFGSMKETHQTAMNVGKPVFAKVQKEAEKNESKRNKKKRKKQKGLVFCIDVNAGTVIASECPLAADHISQGVNNQSKGKEVKNKHPIELLWMSYTVQGEELPPSPTSPLKTEK